MVLISIMTFRPPSYNSTAQVYAQELDLVDLALKPNRCNAKAMYVRGVCSVVTVLVVAKFVYMHRLASAFAKSSNDTRRLL
jgi:hypothetical protein